MKAAACGTWLGDLITALIVTDIMLQDNLYPGWAPNLRLTEKKIMLTIFGNCKNAIGTVIISFTADEF